MAKTSELLSGTCLQLLFSPKGAIEGLLMTVQGRTVQVSMPAETGSAMARKTAAGKRLRVLASPDDSPKAVDAVHPVYRFDALADADGNALDWPSEGDGLTTMKGFVARLHYAKHGEPNGVVLESGEFIHLRPHGLAALGLDVGAKITASGELRTTVLGTRMLEARVANGVEIE